MFCTKCGTKNDDDVKFCVGCGQKIITDKASESLAADQQATQTTNLSTPKKTRKSIWKILLKIVVILILTSIAIGVFTFAYQWYQDLPRKTDQLGVITIGMKQVDVTLKLGKPDRETTNDAGKLGYVYNDYSEIDYFVAFDEQNKVRRICTQDIFKDVMGLGINDSEDDITDKLGEPSGTSVNAEGTRKLLSYADYQVSFEIEKGQVSLVCVSNTEMKYTDEY